LVFSSIIQSENLWTILTWSIISAQVVLHVLHLYFMTMLIILPY